MIILISGIAVVFISGLLIDRWFYGKWTVTAWNYFQQNILFDKVSGFGLEPWWFYIQSTFFEGIPPFSLVYIAALILFFIFRRKDFITWTLLPFVAVHFFIGHKEMRFLFPILGFLPVVIIKSIDLMSETRKQDFLAYKPVKYFAKIFWSANLVMVAVVMVVPVDTETKLFQKIYRDYPSATTLYFVNENPYHRALDIHFYKRKNLTIEKVDSIEQIKIVSGRTSLVVTRTNPEIEGLRLTRKLIYCNFSDWINHFNFNHWIERTHFWYVYELTPTPVP
jgi:phosphatidylinositol glycan class B